MGADKFENSLESGIHKNLGLLSGEWEGTTSVWFEPTKPEDESPIQGSMKAILGGRFVQYEYETFFKGKAVSGVALIGHSFSTGNFQIAWVDSFHMGTGILFSEGNEPGKLVSALGSYGGEGIPEPWGWRTEIEMPSNDQVIITAYNISPEGESQKATETIYTRKTA